MTEEIRGTIGQYEDFLQGVVWQDVLRQMEIMREAVRDNLESCTEVEEIYRFQGRAEVLRDIRILPEQILEALKEDKASEERLTNNIDRKDVYHDGV